MSLLIEIYSYVLVPVGFTVLTFFYNSGLEKAITVGPLLSSVRRRPGAWGENWAWCLFGGHTFNGFVVYELVWELAVYGVQNRAAIYHHVIFTALSGGMCWTTSFAYVGASFQIMELSTIPLKVKRLATLKDYSQNPGLKTINTAAGILFAITFFLTRVAHLSVTVVIFFKWIAEGSIKGFTPGPAYDCTIGLLLLGAFGLQLYWFRLIVKKVIYKERPRPEIEKKLHQG